MVSYVYAVVALTVIRVLLFVLHVCMLRECGGAGDTAMLLWGADEVWLWLVQGSGIVSSAPDVLWMSVVRGMRGIGGVCEMGMCMCVFRLGRCGWRGR